MDDLTVQRYTYFCITIHVVTIPVNDSQKTKTHRCLRSGIFCRTRLPSADVRPQFVCSCSNRRERRSIIAAVIELELDRVLFAACRPTGSRSAVGWTRHPVQLHSVVKRRSRCCAVLCASPAWRLTRQRCRINGGEMRPSNGRGR